MIEIKSVDYLHMLSQSWMTTGVISKTVVTLSKNADTTPVITHNVVSRGHTYIFGRFLITYGNIVYDFQIALTQKW